MSERFPIKKESVLRYSTIFCSDCHSEENLKMCEDNEIILCKYCVQDRLDEIKEDEAQKDEIDTWEGFVKEDHLNTWRKNA